MSNTNAYDPALLAKLPKEYLREDIGHRLIKVAIVFLVLQTVFTALFYISRYLNKMLNGLECWLVMPIAYIFSTALCVCGLCKGSSALFYTRQLGSSDSLQSSCNGVALAAMSKPSFWTTQPRSS